MLDRRFFLALAVAWTAAACQTQESATLAPSESVERSALDADGDGFTSAQGDCDDDPGACGADCYPGATELCDGYDNDCDASTDEGFFDNDSDGSADCVDTDDDDDGTPDASDPCPFITGTSGCSDDADRDGLTDGNETLVGRYDPNIAGSGTPERCDGLDNDGDLTIDEGTGCVACN